KATWQAACRPGKLDVELDDQCRLLGLGLRRSDRLLREHLRGDLQTPCGVLRFNRCPSALAHSLAALTIAQAVPLAAVDALQPMVDLIEPVPGLWRKIDRGCATLLVAAGGGGLPRPHLPRRPGVRV